MSPSFPVTSASATLVTESATLRVVSEMVNAGGYEVVLVTAADDESVRGVVLRDAVLRLSARLPDAPLRLLPLRKVAELAAPFDLPAAMELLADDEVEAVIQLRSAAEGWCVMLRDELLRASEAATSTAA